MDSGSNGADGRRYRCGHANFLLEFRGENRREHFFFVFFFRLIGENQCGRITRNTEKNLPGLMYTEKRGRGTILVAIESMCACVCQKMCMRKNTSSSSTPVSTGSNVILWSSNATAGSTKKKKGLL